MSSPTVYFGFGSNIWKDQVKARCATSEPYGIARLPGYSWFIAELGGANIKPTGSSDDEVWGMSYTLQPKDEEQLDALEKVATGHFDKAMIQAEIWELGKDGQPADISKPPQKREVLVYVSPTRTKTGKPREEYVVRMNHSIEVARKEGIPEAYIQNVLRKYIPEQNPIASK